MHRPDDRQVERHIIMGSTKHRAVDDLSARPSKIIRTELQSMVKEPSKNGIIRLSPYLHVNNLYLFQAFNIGLNFNK